jgi:hypothetical protein
VSDPSAALNAVSLAALVLSIVGTTLGGISLGWQVWSWRRSGPLVVLTAGHHYPVREGRRIGALHISVTAHNRGRAPVQITGWTFEAPGNRCTAPFDPVEWSTPLPHVLSNGSQATWHVPASELESQCEILGVTFDDLRPVVTLGTGAAVRARTKGIGWVAT